MLHLIDEKLSQDILRGIVIPPCPQIVADIQLECAMPDSDINVIAGLINRDAGISGSVLKAINSPFFGLASKVNSVSHAVNLLGLKSVINIVTALSLKNVLSDDNISTMNRFWDTASDVANAATIVSKYAKLSTPDEAYSIGLFHDCGIPLMMMKFPDYMSVLEEAYAADDKNITDIETEHYKTDHTILGFYTAKAWKISDHVCKVISIHHCCKSIFDNNHDIKTQVKDLLAVLKIAEHVSASFKTLGGSSKHHEWEQVKDYVLDYAGLVDDDLINLVDECKEAGVI
ncbi:MAG: HD-like signal output (HDOD) protein [Oleiphilaceae bacterium]|jgi:HD-like signal output (HDOD) protein